MISNEYVQPLPDASDAVKIRELNLSAEVRGRLSFNCHFGDLMGLGSSWHVKKLTPMQTSAATDLILSGLTANTRPLFPTTPRPSSFHPIFH